MSASQYVRKPYTPPKLDASVLTGPMSINADRDRFRLMVDGHEVPYIQVVDVTDEWRAAPPSDPEKWADDAYRLQRVAVETGERVFSLTLDGRFGITATESEVERWTWFLANSMAVSAGYTSHGTNSRRLNRHGTSTR